jgi:hypothetical protein
MPILTRPLVPSGAVVELLVGVNEARREVLQRNSLPILERIRVPAQIDTGTAFSAIDAQVFQRLDIRPIDSILVRTPSTTEAPQSFPQYAVSLALDADGIEMFLTSVEVIECAFAPEEGIRAMLGRDVLEHCLLVYDGKGKVFMLGF